MAWRGGDAGGELFEERIASMWLAMKTLGAMLRSHGMEWGGDDGGELFEKRIASMWLATETLGQSSDSMDWRGEATTGASSSRKNRLVAGSEDTWAVIR